MNGYDVMARILQAEGVEYLMAFPHQTLIEACSKIGIKPIICRQERAGVNMADGFSRMTNGRTFGVFAMQQGPGAENAFGGIAQAYADSIPMLHLPGGEALARQGVEPTFDAVRNYEHITKWGARIHKTGEIPAMMRRALGEMKNGRLGPVLLEMPGEVMYGEFEGDLNYTPVKRRLSAASSEDVRDLVTALLKASNPIINAGHGLMFAEATDELVEFAELTQVPVMTTLAGKSGFPENHPLALGAGGSSRTLMVRRFVDNTDFVLGVGTSFTRNTFTTPMRDNVVMAQVTNCAEDIGKDYEIMYGAVGDAKVVLRQMIEEAKSHLGEGGRQNDAAARVAAVRKEFMDIWGPHMTSDEVPISPYRVIHELANAVDVANTTITHDSGYPREQLVPIWQPTTPRGYFGWGKSTQLGYGLGLALGAKMAAPERTVINIMGDAAFGMSGLDLETGVRMNIGILTVVLNNGVMTQYDSHMPNASDVYGSNQLAGNYADVGAALGTHAERVDDPNALAGAIQRALAATNEGQPAVLEVMTKAEPNVPK
ncbi:MAG: thiamine pyrophosphate-requiring protein [Chloroflexota bacterium]